MVTERWNDARLDDLAEEVRHTGRQAERIPVIEANLTVVGSDAKGARDSVAVLRQELNAREIARVSERKSDRRFLIGTCLTAAALVIAAIQVLQGAL